MSGRQFQTPVAGIASACLLMLSYGALAQERTVQDILGQRGQAPGAPVEIEIDRLGVVIRDSSLGSVTSVAQRLEQFGLTLDEAVSDEMLLFAVPDAQTRQQTALLARRLLEAEPDGLAAAGMIVHLEGSELPLIAPAEIVVKYVTGTDQADIDELHRRAGVEIVRGNPFEDLEYLVRLSDSNVSDSIEVSNALIQSAIVEYAHPNFYSVVQQRQVSLNDTYFRNQWHLDNTGQAAGTIDADIDAPEAWELSLGSSNVIIAVIDNGFDVTHQDFQMNLWSNPGEVPNDGIDNDGNGFVDDINGWDFRTCDGSSNVCGDNTLGGAEEDEEHGTAVAGLAAARGNNGLGVSGSCPVCRLMLVRRGGSAFNDSLAIGYARTMGAHIITNSWGRALVAGVTGTLENAVDSAADSGRGGLGSVVLFAMPNENQNECSVPRDISSLEKVIAVSGSTNWDRFDETGYGDCMDVLGTSGIDVLQFSRGTLPGVTTDLNGTAGYNEGAGDACISANEPMHPPADALSYTFCFEGTSFATPVVAGAVGLILSVNPSLTRLQVQRLLQDTADKTEPSLGNYDPETGFSNEALAQDPATHGFGRINAFEAVRIASPAAGEGLGGVDLFMRDNALDWGNTEQLSSVTFEKTRGFLGHWQSVDIKIDAPPYQAPPADSKEFALLIDEAPEVGASNRAYVRVRNRGFRDAHAVAVKLLWTQFSTALPNFPDGTIWTDFTDAAKSVGDWEQLGVRSQASMGYSGASVANEPDDQAAIFRFDNFAPTFDPTRPNHFCLYAVVTSEEDPVRSTTLIPDQATPANNNVSHRNVHVAPGSIPDGGRDEAGLIIRNPLESPIATFLEIDAPRGWRVRIEGLDRPEREFELAPGEARLVTVRISARRGSAGEVSITQFRRIEERAVAMGGATIRYQSEDEIRSRDPRAWLQAQYPELIAIPE